MATETSCDPPLLKHTENQAHAAQEDVQAILGHLDTFLTISVKIFTKMYRSIYCRDFITYIVHHAEKYH